MKGTQGKKSKSIRKAANVRQLRLENQGYTHMIRLAKEVRCSQGYVPKLKQTRIEIQCKAHKVGQPM
jgi:hypothetical protein